MKNKIVLLIVLVVLAFAGILFWKTFNSQITTFTKESFKPMSVKEDKTSSPKQDSTKNWNTLTNLNHAFKYPAEAKGEARENESLVYFMGQKQIDSGRTQTELFDGYSFRVGEILNESNMSLRQLAEAEVENARDNCQSEEGEVTKIKPTTVGAEEAFQYSATGCYIDYTESIVAHDGSFYRISQSYAGDAEDQGKYKEITNQILASFQFTR